MPKKGDFFGHETCQLATLAEEALLLPPFFSSKEDNWLISFPHRHPPTQRKRNIEEKEVKAAKSRSEKEEKKITTVGHETKRGKGVSFFSELTAFIWESECLLSAFSPSRLFASFYGGLFTAPSVS